MKHILRRLFRREPRMRLPAEEHLHQALYFLSQRKINLTYEEICWAMKKSGFALTEEEQQKFEKLTSAE